MIELFNAIFLQPVINLLVLIYFWLNNLAIPGALGLAVIILTLIIRIVVWPLMASQLKSAKKLADLKPHMDELKRKHKDDKQALSQAQMQLYKEHGVNPAGGCLPALLQIPVFIALYQAIIDILPGAGGSLDKLNSLLYFPWLNLSTAPDPHFLGVNLGVKPADFATGGVLLLLIPLITAALTFIQSKMMAPTKITHHADESTKEVKEKESLEDSMGAVQSQMVYLMPLMIGYFAFTFPVGLAIYWNTYTILGIIQQYRISGWGGMFDLWKKVSVRY